MVAKITSRIVGALFVAIGLVVFLRGGAVDPYHNLLHIATGVVALAVGVSRSTAAAWAFCLGGAFYLVFGGLGMALGDPAMDRQWQVGPMSLDVMDHGFHIVLGLILLASGLVTRRATPSAREVAFS
jgi:hypothetical protein